MLRKFLPGTPFRMLAVLCGAVVLLATCRPDKDEPAAPAPPPVDPGPQPEVTFDPALGPHATLSAYGFFTGPLKDLQPIARVLPYDLIDPLFTDYAKKQRHVWLPPDSRATWNGADRVFEFPDGAILIKTFYYEHVQPSDERRIIETRLMYRWGGEWHFANYVWNPEQTEAYLDLDGSYTSVAWVDDEGNAHATDYRIPAEAECGSCHKYQGEHAIVGPKPRNLARAYTYADGPAQQLQRWVDHGILDELPSVDPMPDWRDATVPVQERVRAYLDINCAHCHSASGYCSYRPMRFAWEETTDPVNLGICVEPHDPIAPGVNHIVARTRPDRSMMVYRMASTEVSVRMPLLGRSLVHEEALSLIETWISGLEPPCP